MMCKRLIGFLVVACGFAPASLSAQSLPPSFTLGRYVPGDWWMYVHFVHNPEQEWLEKEWAEVWDALGKSGIDKDLLNLITGLLSDEQRTKTESTMAKVRELLDGVDWSRLVAQEVAFAERIAPPLPHYAIFTRGAEGSGEKNAKGLAAILQYLASFSDKVKLQHETRDDIEVWILRINMEDIQYNPHLFRKGDVIGLVTSAATFNETVSLMKGTAEKPAMVSTPRFLEALKQVKAPEDGVMYFDAKMFLADLDSFVDFGFAKAGKSEGDSKGIKVVKKALGLCDFMDYQIMTTETEDRRTLTHGLGRIQSNKMDSPLAKMCHQRKAFDRFDKYIPADATGFSMDTFIDLGLLYHTVLDFIENNVQDGADIVKSGKDRLATVGFDPDRDLFAWWGGEILTVEMPAAVVTPMGGSDAVFMVRVKDPQLAGQKVNSLIQWSKTMLEEKAQQTLLVNTNPGGLEGFTEVTHPMMAMFVRPVIGVRDDWLMIGSSVGAVNKCLDVSSGRTPSILKNERFQKEGLVPKGAVTASSFRDTSNFAQELGQGLGMASMVGGMMAASIPTNDQDPDAKKGKELIQKVFGLLMKLSPVVAKIDFYSSESSMSVADGPVIRTERVVTYKPSTPSPKTTTPDK